MARDLGSRALAASVRRHGGGVGTPARTRRQPIFETRIGGLMEGREVVGVTDAEMHDAHAPASFFGCIRVCMHCAGRSHAASPTAGSQPDKRLWRGYPDKKHIERTYSGVQPANTNTECAASPVMSSMEREPATDADTRYPIQGISYGPMTQLKTRPSFFKGLFKRHLHQSGQLTSNSIANPSPYAHSKLSTSCM